MKEININIEGYNVNGICVGCLNYNRKMFYTNEINDCYKNLAGIDVPDGLSIQICWECLASVRTANRFRTQILQAFDILMDYSNKHTFLNSPEDLSQYSHQRLSSAMIEGVHVKPPQNDTELIQPAELILHEELEFKTEKFEVDDEFEPVPKQELEDTQMDFHEDTLEFNHETVSEGFPDAEPSSDDEDVQLSKLKRKKEKREKKSKKKKGKENKLQEIKVEEDTSTTKGSRKLKNLPENLVELYTMTEDEMWQVRTEDLQSKVFLKLKYKCEDCIIGFNTEKLMKDHMSGKHVPKSPTCQKCDICKAYFLTKDNLSVHRSLHMKAFRCIQCGITTCMKRIMDGHVRVHTGGERYPCPTCDKSFSTKSKLSYHKNVCHQEKPQCDCCGKVFANKMTLKYHLKLLPQNKEEKPKEKLYIPCKGCNKVFHSKKSYRAHVVIHDGLTYPCPICGKLFQWKRNLARHTRVHREREAGALHECRECRKTFSSRDCYNNHMKLSKRHVPAHMHPHECSYCGKKFATKWCMVDHIDWDHLKRIKYQCSVCFKPFKTAKIMVAHMNNIHDGKKNKEPDGEHLCEICGKSYKTVKRLKGHVWAMHTNRSTTKSFKCKLCPATFTWQTSIYKHIKMMHSSAKRGKTQQVKKPPPYPAVDAARIQYFTHFTPDLQTHNIIPNNLT